jgi:hypothetical protein
MNQGFSLLEGSKKRKRELWQFRQFWRVTTNTSAHSIDYLYLQELKKHEEYLHGLRFCPFFQCVVRML